jgi:hypothetical protein
MAGARRDLAKILCAPNPARVNKEHPKTENAMKTGALAEGEVISDGRQQQL